MTKSKGILLVDVSMSGLEGGQCRVYKSVAPTIQARTYKEPFMIVETADNKGNMHERKV